MKTYQNDLYNNWMRTTWVEGMDGINELSSVVVTGGEFSMNQLNIAEKVFIMLNNIANAGGSWDNWVQAVYDEKPVMMPNIPIYAGGLSKEKTFDAVVSNSAANGQPLGTLAGRGVMTSKHKGGKIRIKCQEHCIILGVNSITPRIDYSQGNRWFNDLKTMDDFHKPPMDQIGYQHLVTDRMAWWSTAIDANGDIFYQTAGLQPAWIEYTSNVNRTYGNFAIKTNEMFMTLNRNYEPIKNTLAENYFIADLTTYIDPKKYN